MTINCYQKTKAWRKVRSTSSKDDQNSFNGDILKSNSQNSQIVLVEETGGEGASRWIKIKYTTDNN